MRVRLNNLEPGSDFTDGGQLYRLVGISGDEADVMLLEKITNQVTQRGKMKTAFIGKERLTFPADTEVESDAVPLVTDDETALPPASYEE